MRNPTLAAPVDLGRPPELGIGPDRKGQARGKSVAPEFESDVQLEFYHGPPTRCARGTSRGAKKPG